MNYRSTIAFSVLLSACASQSYWYQPDTQMHKRHRDEMECRTGAWQQQQNFVDVVPKPQNLTTEQAAVHAIGAVCWSLLIFDTNFGLCMKAHGYKAMSKKEYHAAIERDASRASQLNLAPQY